jgi:hypothetical protein
MTDTVSIKGLNKADVLCALYNHARPVGLGFLQVDDKIMDRETAEQILADRTGFEYLKGRPLKISLAKDDVSPFGYDRDQGGPGTVARLIDRLRADAEAA